MPPFQVYGRIWAHGADDLAVPACGCGLGRLVWLTIYSFVLASFLDADSCPTQELRWLQYLLILLVVTECVVVLHHGIALMVALRGNIIEVEKRRSMPLLVRIYAVLLFLEASAMSYAAWFLAQTWATSPVVEPCDHAHAEVKLLLVRVTLTAHWVQLGLSLCCGILALALSHPAPEEPYPSNEQGNGGCYQTMRRWYCWGECEQACMEDEMANGNQLPLLSGSGSGSLQTTQTARRLDGAGQVLFTSPTTASEGDEEDSRGEEVDYFPTSFDDVEFGIRRPSRGADESSLLGGNDSTGGIYQSRSTNDGSDDSEHSTWTRRLRVISQAVGCLTCGLFGGGPDGAGGPEAFQQVALVLAGWFKNLDLVPSDIVAALLLMRAEQRDQEQAAVAAIIRQQQLLQARSAGESSSPSTERTLPRLTHVRRWMWAGVGANTRAWTTLHAQRVRASRDALVEGALDADAVRLLTEAQELSPYMLGMYGWVLYSYMHGPRGWFTLCCGSPRVSSSEENDRGFCSICLSPLACCASCLTARCCWCCSSSNENDPVQERRLGDSSSDHAAYPRAPASVGSGVTPPSASQSSQLHPHHPFHHGGQSLRSVLSTPMRSGLATSEEDELLHTPRLVPDAPNLFAFDDTCCNLNASALEHSAGRNSAANADVVYASFTAQLGHTIPYCVCVDHNKRRVVVAVGGTMSVNDAVMDLTMVPEPLKDHAERWGFLDEIDSTSSYCHSGILGIAAWVRADLERQDVLHRLFRIARLASETPDPERGMHHGHSIRSGVGEAFPRDDAEEDVRSRAFSVDLDALPDCRGYGLDITGHALGAGVAVVLSLFLRPAFPFVRCMAFSPPGCVFDWKLAERSSEWVSTLFVGKDYVARMSWHSLFKVRGQILDTLRRQKTNKIVAMASALTGAPVSRLLFEPALVPDTPHTRAFEKKLDELVASRRNTILDDVRLYMPGKILHLVKHQTVSTRFAWLMCLPNQTAQYVPVWVDDRSALDEVLLSSRMVWDHLPNVVDATLRDVVKEYLGPIQQRGQAGLGLGSSPLVNDGNGVEANRRARIGLVGVPFGVAGMNASPRSLG